MEKQLFGHEKGAFPGRSSGARRLLRAGSERHSVAGRNRRHAHRHAGQAAAGASRIPRVAAAWAARASCWWMCASSPSPTRCSRTRCAKANFATTCTTVSTCSTSRCRRCAARMEDLPLLVEALPARPESEAQLPGRGSRPPGFIEQFAATTAGQRARSCAYALERAVIMAGDGDDRAGTSPPQLQPCLRRPQSRGRRRGRPGAAAPRLDVGEAEKIPDPAHPPAQPRYNKTRAAEILGISLKNAAQHKLKE